MKFLQFLYYVIAIGAFCGGLTAIILYGGGGGAGDWLFLLGMAVAAIFLGLAQASIKK